MSIRLSRFIFLVTILVGLTLVLSPIISLAHGGEDHGDQKPKSTSNAKGVVTHSSRLGELEVMVKHPVLEPDQAASGLLFLTTFDTNESFTGADVKVDLESAGGAILNVSAEAGSQPGTFNLAFPLLQEGSYKMRTNVTHGGETDTVTFTGLDVKPSSSVAGEEVSWLTKTMIAFLFSLVVILLTGLLYLVWRFAGDGQVQEQPISA